MPIRSEQRRDQKRPGSFLWSIEIVLPPLRVGAPSMSLHYSRAICANCNQPLPRAASFRCPSCLESFQRKCGATVAMDCCANTPPPRGTHVAFCGRLPFWLYVWSSSFFCCMRIYPVRLGTMRSCCRASLRWLRKARADKRKHLEVQNQRRLRPAERGKAKAAPPRSPAPSSALPER